MTGRPDPDQGEVDVFVAHLEALGDWETARYLTARTGTDERTLRELANRANGRIISGQRGYKATSCATPGEVDHAVAWLRSQAREMMQRADAIHANHLRHLTQRDLDATPWFEAPEHLE